jgi:trehalose 6-phosphate synthase/phosphatase
MRTNRVIPNNDIMESRIKEAIIRKYLAAKNRLVLLDYDGTLVDYTTLPDTAKLPENLSEIINRLIGNPKTKIFIVTGRSHEDIDKLLTDLPVDVIAEHGAFSKKDGVWINQVKSSVAWKEKLISVFGMITAACPDSYLEEKKYSLTWHYRNADPDLGYACSRELIQLLRNKVHFFNLKILDGNKVVEVLSNETGKGLAVKKLYEQDSFDFVLSIGDDATDEEMFEYFLHNSDAFTIKVGEGATSARYNFKSITDVAALLKLLTE